MFTPVGKRRKLAKQNHYLLQIILVGVLLESWWKYLRFTTLEKSNND